MQVPSASQLFGVPKREVLECNEDVPPFGETSIRRGQLLGNVDMSSLLNFPESSVAIKHLKLKWRKFEKLATQVGGARNIFCKLFGANKAENTFWLDSSSVEKVFLFLLKFSFSCSVIYQDKIEMLSVLDFYYLLKFRFGV